MNFKDYKDIVLYCDNNNIKLWVEDSKLKYKASSNKVSKDLLMNLKKYKEDIIKYLNESVNLKLSANKEERYEEFPLTDVQSAYMLGRTDIFDYGEVACHLYMEIKYKKLEHKKVEDIWNELINKHDMLRSVVYENGNQKVLKDVPRFNIENINAKMDNYTNKLEDIQNRFSKKRYELGKWPMFELAISEDKASSLHLSIDFLIADWASIWMVLNQFEQMYFDGYKNDKIFEISFRDYVLYEKKLKTTVNYEKDKKYWMDRLDNFPKAPTLPILNNKSLKTFTRHTLRMSKDKWDLIKDKTVKRGLTPTIPLLTLYSNILSRWSSNRNFCLNLTVLNRMDIHKDIKDIVGDFTSINLLETNIKKQSFLDQAKDINKRLFEDLDHRLFSGVEFIREISKEKGRDYAFMPFVFTSAIGLSNRERPLRGDIIAGISQTPQLFIDCQVMDGSFGLQINWDIRDGVFPKNMIEDMFRSFEEELIKLSENENYWDEISNLDLEVKANNIINSFDKSDLLYTKFIQNVKQNPKKIAVIDNGKSYTYEEIHNGALYISKLISKCNINLSSNIPILVKDGVNKVIGTLGILYSGCVYVPIDKDQPIDRIENIINDTNAKIYLKDVDINIENYNSIFIDTKNSINQKTDESIIRNIKNDENAYIIYTSGSTGKPKGVVISHKAALNTIYEINQRYDIDKNDSIFAISKLNFDLSVYDIFGLLCAGGTIVYTKHDEYMNPQKWSENIIKYNVTIWNSVPALMKMLLTELKSSNKENDTSLRQILLSGDWIPLDMPDEIKSINNNIEIACMGGATEASIWSNVHDYKKLDVNWKSIPYGRPLKNQGFKILNENMQDCPVFVPGKLYIYGEGLAKEYLNDEALTNKKFINHNGIRIYETGDMGRYLENKEIEFLGRKDNQVKIRGNRVELGEIENSLNSNSNIDNSIVFLDKYDKKSELIAVIKKNKTKLYDNNFNENIKKYLKNLLPLYMVPSEFIILDEFGLTLNGKVNRKNIIKKAKEKLKNTRKLKNISNINIQNSKTDKEIIKICKELLEVENLKKTDDLYDYGADSLLMAQISTRIKNELNLKIPFDSILRYLLNNSTIADISNLISKEEEALNKEEEKNNESKDIVGKNGLSYMKYISKDEINKNKKLLVIVHGPVGSIDNYKYLVQELKKNKNVDIAFIGIKDLDQYIQLDPKNIINILSNEYFKHILDTDYESYELLGYCFSSVIAIEIANQMTEIGKIIDKLSVIDGGSIFIDVKEEILYELLYLTHLNLELEDLWGDNANHMKKSVLDMLDNSRNVYEDEVFMKNLNELKAKTQEERFRYYLELSNSKNETKIDYEFVKDFLKVFINSFKALSHVPIPYFGDINYYLSTQRKGLFEKFDTLAEKWSEYCIGDLNITKITGDHFSCIEEKEHASKLGNYIRKAL